MAKGLTGGCACGAVRYRLLSEPLDPAWCHCRTCQLNSGSPAMAFATVPVAHMIFEQGADLVRQFASSDFGHRKFCTRCGTPLLMQVNHEPDTLDFSLATLDDPQAVIPEYHIYYDSRIGWALAGDGLPTYAKERPKC